MTDIIDRIIGGLADGCCFHQAPLKRVEHKDSRALNDRWGRRLAQLVEQHPTYGGFVLAGAAPGSSPGLGPFSLWHSTSLSLSHPVSCHLFSSSYNKGHKTYLQKNCGTHFNWLMNQPTIAAPPLKVVVSDKWIQWNERYSSEKYEFMRWKQIH